LGCELGGKIFVSDIFIAVDLRTKKPETVRSKQRATGADLETYSRLSSGGIGIAITLSILR